MGKKNHLRFMKYQVSRIHRVKKMALLELLAGDGTADLAKTYPATTN